MIRYRSIVAVGLMHMINSYIFLNVGEKKHCLAAASQLILASHLL